MITESEFEAALKVVNEYHHQRMVEAEEDENFEDDDDEPCDDCGHYNCICDIANENNSPVFTSFATLHNDSHVADCCC